MTKLDFTDEDRNQLSYEKDYHPHPRVRKKMAVLYLKSLGMPHKYIKKLEKICENTLLGYFREYQEGGIQRLKEIRFNSPVSLLEPHRQKIKTYFSDHPPASVKEATAKIEELTGIKISPERVRIFMKKLGFRPRKIGMIPAKADAQAQQKFIDEVLEPRITQAQAGHRALYFLDAAHFVLAPFLGYLWTLTRIFIRAPAGRHRFNVLGALHAVTHQLITFTNDSYINSDSVCELLLKIAEASTGIPISVVLDNARYQRCYKVISYAEQLGIELLFLPPYSPNLNLIERLWKFVKKQCLYSRYYGQFAEFKASITACLSKTHTEYKQELDSLLSLKFQSFQNVHIVAL